MKRGVEDSWSWALLMVMNTWLGSSRNTTSLTRIFQFFCIIWNFFMSTYHVPGITCQVSCDMFYRCWPVAYTSTQSCTVSCPTLECVGGWVADSSWTLLISALHSYTGKALNKWLYAKKKMNERIVFKTLRKLGSLEQQRECAMKKEKRIKNSVSSLCY